MLKIAKQADILEFLQRSYSQRKFRYYGFYNSLFGQIITDEKYMILPVDDRTATRAHGVFDVIYLKKRRIINLQQHIGRLFKSAASVNINPPFSQKQTQSIVRQVIEETISHHLSQDIDSKMRDKFINEGLGIRVTISSGFGDLSVASINKQPILYVVLFEPYISYEKERNGVKEYIAKIVKEPKNLVHSKTIDYIQNALMANFSKERGGYQGIKALQNGVLLEAASANIAFIFEKEFATPRFETVIQGTTIKKLLTKVQELVKQGVLEKISFRDITIEQAYKANQMFVIGGDKIVPVLQFNDHKISDVRGPICDQLQLWYEQKNQQGIQIQVLK